MKTTLTSTLGAAALGVGGIVLGGVLATTMSANADTTSTSATSTTGASQTPPSGAPGGESTDTAVTGDEAQKVVDAVEAKHDDITVTSVRMDPDGSYDALGTQGGTPVLVDVSSDLSTITVNAGPGGAPGGAGTTGSSGSSTSSAT